MADDLSRREMFVKLGLLFSGVVSMLMGVPIVGYLLSPVVRDRKGRDESWVSLGSVGDFPSGQTRLSTYRNPVAAAWDGETANVACWVRRIDETTSLWEWRKQVIDGDIDAARRNGSIVAKNSKMEEVARWNFEAGWPSKWTGADFDAELRMAVSVQLSVSLCRAIFASASAASGVFISPSVNAAWKRTRGAAAGSTGRWTTPAPVC